MTDIDLSAMRKSLPDHALIDAAGTLYCAPLSQSDHSEEGFAPLKASEACARWGNEAFLVVNAPVMRQSLFGSRPHLEKSPFDLLELFAFVCPARFCAPTLSGLMHQLDILDHKRAPTAKDAWRLLAILTRSLTEAELGFRLMAEAAAVKLKDLGWVWADYVLDVLKKTDIPEDYHRPDPLIVWPYLEPWEDEGPVGAPLRLTLEFDEVEAPLKQVLSKAGLEEDRPEQQHFSQKATEIFGTKWVPDQPQMRLVEAGTGVGKTLGYLVPSLLWANKAQGQVWISTYTKALQKQIYQDCLKLFANRIERQNLVALRKGRENYLCLLNFQERLQTNLSPRLKIAAIFLARYALYSEDGDIMSGDFPSWQERLFDDGSGVLNSYHLVDRRGECTFGACQHYRVCFVEKSIRKAKTARLVIANHALVMSQAVRDFDDAPKENHSLSRLVFDEGHHLFDAADQAFSVSFNLKEAFDLRRFIRGPEGRARRGRGIEKRLSGLIERDETLGLCVQNLMRAAHMLPNDLDLLSEDQSDHMMIKLMSAADQQLKLERDPKARAGLDGAEDALAYPTTEAVKLAATGSLSIVEGLMGPLVKLNNHMKATLESDDHGLEASDLSRLEGVLSSIRRRALSLLPAWKDMFIDLADAEKMPEDVPQLIDLLVRDGPGLSGVSINRHYLDPSKAFAETVLKPSHGVLVASATLADPSSDDKEAFEFSHNRTGASHLLLGAEATRIKSPFDYGQQARLIVITDVPKDHKEAQIAAFEALFLAARGGALGLFTAISRIKATYPKLKKRLSEEGLKLYAQHVDAMDVSDLIESFRVEQDACLLGTDAVRDGIDVPGFSLRLMVCERMPWPRPDTLYKVRRAALGGKKLDDAITKARLSQAFGRLIRRKEDRGIFVLLDSSSPSRLLSALPEGVVLQRLTLDEAVLAIDRFLFPHDLVGSNSHTKSDC